MYVLCSKNHQYVQVCWHWFGLNFTLKFVAISRDCVHVDLRSSHAVTTHWVRIMDLMLCHLRLRFLAMVKLELTIFCAAAGKVHGMLHCLPMGCARSNHSRPNHQWRFGGHSSVRDIVLVSWTSKGDVQRIDYVVYKHLLLESLGQCEVVLFCLTIALHALSPPLFESGIYPFISCNNCSASSNEYIEAQTLMCVILKWNIVACFGKNVVGTVNCDFRRTSLFFYGPIENSRPEGPACSLLDWGWLMSIDCFGVSRLTTV